MKLRIPAIAVAVALAIIACTSNSDPQIDPVPPLGASQQGGEEIIDSSSSISGEAPVVPPSSASLSSDDKAVVSSSSRSSSARASSSSRSTSSSSRSGATSSSSVRSSSSAAPAPVVPPPAGTPTESFTETVGSVSFDMVYIPGGTFTIGCEKESGCPADSKPVSGVKVSSYLIGKTEVTSALWYAVMGGKAPSYGASGSFTNMTWYDAHEFACKLGNLTGKKYRMTTEAEWEYAAKNHKDELEKIGSGEEWAYNSWSSTHSGGTDPVGPGSGQHTQKTRRDAQGTSDNITGRLIRSIEGMGPALRLAISTDMELPPTYVSSCDLHAPKMEGEPANSYRDPRWVTGSGARWATNGTIAIGSFDLRVWEDGTAQLTPPNYGYGSSKPTVGQWFTSNNIAFVFVPNSGSSGLTKYLYIFLDDKQGSIISDKGFASGGYIGRIEKQEAANVDKPTVADLKSGEALAKAQANFDTEFKMVDMTNIPASAQKQDSRLLDGGAEKGWFQNNTSAGGVHHYRKDVDPDEFRFTVNQNNGRTMLANGKWFTVNNSFLRVVHEKSGYTAEYLYAVDADGTFYHNSFMGYERGDFRMFKKETNGDAWPKTTCGNICSQEIPKGLDASMYNRMDNGKSTFTPAPCPASGCK